VEKYSPDNTAFSDKLIKKLQGIFKDVVKENDRIIKALQEPLREDATVKVPTIGKYTLPTRVSNINLIWVRQHPFRGFPFSFIAATTGRVFAVSLNRVERFVGRQWLIFTACRLSAGKGLEELRTAIKEAPEVVEKEMKRQADRLAQHALNGRMGTIHSIETEGEAIRTRLAFVLVILEAVNAWHKVDNWANKDKVEWIDRIAAAASVLSLTTAMIEFYSNSFRSLCRAGIPIGGGVNTVTQEALILAAEVSYGALKCAVAAFALFAGTAGVIVDVLAGVEAIEKDRNWLAGILFLRALAQAFMSVLSAGTALSDTGAFFTKQAGKHISRPVISRFFFWMAEKAVALNLVKFYLYRVSACLGWALLMVSTGMLIYDLQNKDALEKWCRSSCFRNYIGFLGDDKILGASNTDYFQDAKTEIEALFKAIDILVKGDKEEHVATDQTTPT
jgi:hypothetical protein